jgi:hypothetical protein
LPLPRRRQLHSRSHPPTAPRTPQALDGCSTPRSTQMPTNMGILRPTARIIRDWPTHLGQTMTSFFYKLARSLLYSIISIPICRC